MSKTEANGQKAQGAILDPDAPLPKLGEVEKWIDKDVSMCIHFLDAIRQDMDLRRSMATWMLGRLQNARNQEALKKQKDLFEGEQKVPK